MKKTNLIAFVIFLTLHVSCSGGKVLQPASDDTLLIHDTIQYNAAPCRKFQRIQWMAMSGNLFHREVYSGSDIRSKTLK